MASSAVAVTTQFTRTAASAKSRRIRAAVSRIHALSLVYGSRTTETRWNVVSHCSRVRPSPWSGVSVRSIGGLLATAGDGSASGGRVRQVHPIERLRYVARASDADPALVVRETAGALAGLRLDPAGLVTACRRIVERHPTAGPLWWLCARTVTAADPMAEAWRCVEAIEEDPTADELAAALPDDATICVVGWPSQVARALVRRGDVTVLAVDGEGAGLARRLRRLDVEAEEVAPGALAAAATAADVILVEAEAIGPDGFVAPLGSHAAAAVGYCAEVPVWLLGGVGRLLPEPLWHSVLARLASEREPWELDHDVVPLSLVSKLCGPAGPEDAAAGLRRLDCPVAPELLRSSPF